MKFQGPVTLPSELIANYHEVESIKLDFSREVIIIDILSWGSEDAAKNGYRNDRQLISAPFSAFPGIAGLGTAIKSRLTNPGGPLAGTTALPD